MKWLKEKDNLYNLIYKEEMTYDKIGKIYGVTGAAIRKAAKRIWGHLPKRRTINPKETFNKGAGKISKCLYCGKDFVKYQSTRGTFCCTECFVKYKAQEYIKNWKLGVVSGTVCYNCSAYIRTYLLQKNNYKCEKCGWGELNPATNKVPLQIHHIDGNSENNVESNLQVLCPNCHSLTENFGSRNKNSTKGRSIYYGKAKG